MTIKTLSRFLIAAGLAIATLMGSTAHADPVQRMIGICLSMGCGAQCAPIEGAFFCWCTCSKKLDVSSAPESEHDALTLTAEEAIDEVEPDVEDTGDIQIIEFFRRGRGGAVRSVAPIVRRVAR
jgi:hypothetical protein